MFVRTLLVTDHQELSERVLAALPAEVELLESCRISQLDRCLSDEDCDLVLLGPDALTESPEQEVTRIRTSVSSAEVVVFQRQEVAERRAVLLAAGALGVIPEELSQAGLKRALGAFVERRRETLLLRSYAESRRESLLLTSKSRSMLALLTAADRVAEAGTPVLILGETGSGKEWLARRIHERGNRSKGAFVAVNCAAVTPSLWESEIFGHERGAFTGAETARRGRFEMAHRGTLFLDEIGETPPSEQAKLLRAVESGEIQRVGAELPMTVDARLVSATNRDLEKELSEGRFRRDLFYRLAVVTLHLPPLRERLEDLEPLAEHYLHRASLRLAKPPRHFSPAALTALRRYPWPGNDRELANVIERAVLLAGSDEIGLGDLPPALDSADGRRPLTGTPTLVPDLDRPLREIIAEESRRTEHNYLHAQLSRFHGKLAAVAKHTGLPPRSLHRKMRELGLRKADYLD